MWSVEWCNLQWPWVTPDPDFTGTKTDIYYGLNQQLSGNATCRLDLKRYNQWMRNGTVSFESAVSHVSFNSCQHVLCRRGWCVLCAVCFSAIYRPASGKTCTSHSSRFSLTNWRICRELEMLIILTQVLKFDLFDLVTFSFHFKMNGDVGVADVLFSVACACWFACLFAI